MFFAAHMLAGNVITYEATEKLSDLTDADFPGNSIVSHTFSNGHGIIEFQFDVEDIWTAAFQGNTSLLSITIPNSVSVMCSSIFKNCMSLCSVTFEGSQITDIPHEMFMGCSSLSSVSIPSSVTEIGTDAFSGCTALSSVTLPSGVTKIGSDAFSGCTTLTSISIPSSVTEIGGGAFSGCTALKSMTIPMGVTTLGYKTFADCTSLSSIIIPNSVTEIGYSAFENCVSLSFVLIPSSVRSIWNNAFYGCTSLVSIIIPKGVTSIEEYTFYGCLSLTSVVIPDGVTDIGNDAFYGCTSLMSVTVPNSVTHIGSDAFEGVPHVVYHGNATGAPWGAKCVNGYVDGNLVYSDASKTTLMACSAAQTGEVIIPDNVTSLGDYVFCECSGITSVIIPNGVTSIGTWPFMNCTSLLSVTIPSGVMITNGAFSGCTSLKTITVLSANPPSWVGLMLDVLDNVETIYIPLGTMKAYKNDSFWRRYADKLKELSTSVTTYTITVTYDSEKGFAIGGGSFSYGETATLLAQPLLGYEFVSWSNGVTDNPYIFAVTEDMTIEALFVPITAVETISDAGEAPKKVLRDGQVLILRGDSFYTLMGIEVK